MRLPVEVRFCPGSAEFHARLPRTHDGDGTPQAQDGRRPSAQPRYHGRYRQRGAYRARVRAPSRPDTPPRLPRSPAGIQKINVPPRDSRD